MSFNQLGDLFDMHPPYFTRPDPATVSAAFLAVLPSLTLKRETEFGVCAMVTSCSLLYPHLINDWASFRPRILAHWAKLKLQTDRPGMNDFHICAWGITGRDDHIQELITASARSDTTRGATAQWAINTLTYNSPDFCSAITRIRKSA
jgi:hypothetical protein